VRHLDDTITVPYTQLCWRCAGHGHPDHIASARLVRAAMLRAKKRPEGETAPVVAGLSNQARMKRACSTRLA
jgi:LmbE family N-acetylglucosaminyl deacetylase